MKTDYKIDSSVQIKNANGTAERECRCGSWIVHWKKFSAEEPRKCSVSECENDGTEGAHVLRPEAKNEDLKTHPYIVPMCKEHNGMHEDTFTTKEQVTFVWANKGETCEAES